MTELNIHWPAIVKYDDDDELGYAVNQQQWDKDNNLPHIKDDGSDILIDSSGKVFRLMFIENNIVINATNEIKTLEEILGLVKGHAAQAGSCCVAKLYAPSISESFKIVASTLDH